MCISASWLSPPNPDRVTTATWVVQFEFVPAIRDLFLTTVGVWRIISGNRNDNQLELNAGESIHALSSSCSSFLFLFPVRIGLETAENYKVTCQ